MDRKDIFMSGFKSKIGYSFTYKDLAEFEAVINFYEQQVKKQKEVIDKAIEFINLINGGVICSEFEPYLNDILKILSEVSE